LEKVPFLKGLAKKPKEAPSKKRYISEAVRPRRSTTTGVAFDSEEGWLIPPHPLSYRDMYNLARLQVNVRTCLKALKWEIFRKGYKWVPKWTAKCTKCGTVYKHLNDNLVCPKCGGDLVSPDPKEYERADKFLLDVNLNHQTFTDVLEEVEDDLNIADDAYLILRKEYFYDEHGYITKGRVKEILRGSPIVMRPVFNFRTGVPGGRYFVCPVHRNNALDVNATNRGSWEDYKVSLDEKGKMLGPPRCPVCNRVMYDAHYVALRAEGGEPEHYYIEGEVINAKKYVKGFAYGIPPLYTIWVMSAALLYQEIYIRDAFEKQRHPRGAITVSTSNPGGMLNMWDTMVQRVKEDPYYIPFIPVEAGFGGGRNEGKMSFVSFLDSLREMEYIPTRDEFRQRISSFYGVSNVFMNDTKVSGGMNTSEGLQVIVTNRSVERGQKVYNDYIFKRLVPMLGVDNWELVLNPTEERDVIKEKQTEQLTMQINQMYQTIGYECIKDPQTGEWFYRKDVTQELQKAIQVMQMLAELMEGDEVDGVDEDNSKEKMTSYQPENIEGFSGEAKGEVMTKARSDGSPNLSSSPTSVQQDVRIPSAGNRNRDAPGMAGGSKKYTCRICGKTFDSKEELGGHMKSVHGGAAGKLDMSRGSEGQPNYRRGTMYRRAVQIMKQSQYFDNNVMNIIEQMFRGKQPTIQQPQPGMGSQLNIKK